MTHDDRASGIGMRDVRESFEAIEEELPVRARIVLALFRPERGRPTLGFKVQAIDGEGRPLSAVPGHWLPWPHPDFKTVSALMHFLLEHLYAQVAYQLEQMPPDPERE
jgi:hypothetical protein